MNFTFKKYSVEDMAKIKMDSRKIMAIVIGVLMVGSSVAFAILSIFSPQQQKFTIPEERILNYELTRDQAQVLLQNGYTIVEYSYPDGCFECLEIKNRLEEIVNTAEGQLYLQEIVSSNTSAVSTVIIANAYTATAKAIENPSVENATVEVCNAMTNPSLWCISGSI